MDSGHTEPRAPAGLHDQSPGVSPTNGDALASAILPTSRVGKVEAREIAESRSQMRTTRRSTVPAMEGILYQPLEVLDKGFVRVIDYMGDDAAIVQAARVSYGRGTRKLREDAGLIRYLMRHRHTTPFEMCEIKLHVKLPIFVARQWVRHRTANVNEYSARFSILDREFYVPGAEYLKSRKEERRAEQKITKSLSSGQAALFEFAPEPSHGQENVSREQVAPQSKSNRQGREGELTAEEAEQIIRQIKSEASRAYTIYEGLLNETASGEIIDPEKPGLARELARMVLPTNIYTQWYWKIDLLNLLHFLSLRADPHAQ